MYIKKELIKLKYFCRCLGVEPSISSINERIKLQKIFYFLKKFGLKLPYKFNFYKHGPYSPYLAKVYYQLENYSKIVRNEKYKINKLQAKKLEQAKKFLDPIKDDVNKLEYYASLLFIFDDMFFFQSKEDIDSARVKKVKELKPELFNEYKIKEPKKKLKNHNLIS